MVRPHDPFRDPMASMRSHILKELVGTEEGGQFSWDT